MKPETRPAENGQAIALYAVIVPVTVLFFLGIVDYMLSNARAMDTLAAADLAAHAGAQRVRLLPDGSPQVTAQAKTTAAAFFIAQAPPEAALTSVWCGELDGRPACRVSAAVESTGYLLPQSVIRITAVGYLASGVTEDDQ